MTKYEVIVERKEKKTETEYGKAVMRSHSVRGMPVTNLYLSPAAINLVQMLTARSVPPQIKIIREAA
jgi:hypothetical protein